MKRLKILVVDDDHDFAESLALALEGRGHEVLVAPGGREALAMFGEHDFHIAFMDVKLPGMNGVESFLRIRKIKPYARIVMMTGYGVEQLLDQAVDNGAWGVLHKPLNMNEVIDLVEKLRPEGILVADDDRDFVEGVTDLLTDKGWAVFAAANGREAIDRILTGSVDVLILDIRMPTLNGLETYRELMRLGRVVPTIIVTAYADEEEPGVEQLRALSVGGIMRKPFDPAELTASVERLATSERTDSP